MRRHAPGTSRSVKSLVTTAIHPIAWLMDSSTSAAGITGRGRRVVFEHRIDRGNQLGGADTLPGATSTIRSRR